MWLPIFQLCKPETPKPPRSRHMAPTPTSSWPRNVCRCHGATGILLLRALFSTSLLPTSPPPPQRRGGGHRVRVIVGGEGRRHRRRRHRGAGHGALPAPARRRCHRAGAGSVPACRRHVADAVQERVARAGRHRRGGRAPGQVPARPGDEDAVGGRRAGSARILLRGRSSWAGSAGGGEASASRDARLQAAAERHLLLVEAQVDRRAGARRHPARARGREAAPLQGRGRVRRRGLADRAVDGVLGAPVRRAHGVPRARGLRRRTAVRAQGELHLRPGPPRGLRPGLPDQGLLVHLLQQCNPRTQDHRRGGAQEGGTGPGAGLAGRPRRRHAEHARRRRGQDAPGRPVALAGHRAAGVEGRRGARRRRVAPDDAQPRAGRVLRAGGRGGPGAAPRARGRRGRRRRRRRGVARVREGEVAARVPADGARGARRGARAVGQPGGVRGAGRPGDPEAGQAGALPRAHQLRVRPARPSRDNRCKTVVVTSFFL